MMQSLQSYHGSAVAIVRWAIGDVDTLPKMESTRQADRKRVDVRMHHRSHQNQDLQIGMINWCPLSDWCIFRPNCMTCTRIAFRHSLFAKRMESASII